MELGIPAAIGVGKSKFDEITQSKFVTLDCQNKHTISIMKILISSNTGYFKTYIDFIDHYWLRYFEKKL